MSDTLPTNTPPIRGNKHTPPPISEPSHASCRRPITQRDGRFLHPLFIHLDQAAAACFKQDPFQLRARTGQVRRTKNMAVTAGSRQDSIAEHFRRSCETLAAPASDGAMSQAMPHATEAMAAALGRGQNIL